MTVPAISSRPSVWSELFTARGRTNRGRFWLILLIFWLATVVVLIPVAVLSRAQQLAGPNDPVQPVLAIGFAVVVAVFAVIWLVVGILVAIRRMHDRDKSGHWLWLLYFLPGVLGAAGDALQKSGADGAALFFLLASFILSIWAFVELGCLRGTVGANRFGPDPLSPDRSP